MNNSLTHWQIELSEAISDPLILCDHLDLDPIAAPYPIDTNPSFPWRIPLSFVNRMQKNSWTDPLLQQVWARPHTQQATPGYTSDPLEESEHTPIPGLLHKYPGRALWIQTSGCAIHCRYCFRQHFPYSNHIKRDALPAILDYLRTQAIEEIILSGGDPLMQTDEKLAHTIKQLATLPCLKRLRIHTRFPVVIPSRLTTDLLNILDQTTLDVILVLHINHPQEINDELRTQLHPWRSRPITLLNQTVLLKNINDNTQALTQLSLSLFDCGILPYYLHMLDPVTGAEHFDIPIQHAQQLHLSIQHTLPGYLVPRLVQEQPGQKSKTWVSHNGYQPMSE